jgi:hypothetical protein
MIDLNTLISQGSGWELEWATGINDSGQIVGVGFHNGLQRAFLLTPLVDTRPPVLTVPDGILVDATSPAGVTVSYTVTASDDVDASPTVACSPSSRTTFAIGDTTVVCITSDAAGHAARASFVVHVRGAAEQLDRLRAAVTGVGRGNGLASVVGAAQRLLGNGRPQATCALLGTFSTLVRAESRAPFTTIPPDTATTLIGNANQIENENVLAC